VHTVDHLARSGVRQFLDIGCGLPTRPNTHEIAQAVVPDARVVYVDNDPQVLIHSRAFQAGRGGVVTYIEADLRDTATVLARAGADLDLTAPVAVLFMGVLGFVDAPEMHHAVRSITSALAPGSHLVLWESTDTSPQIQAAVAAQTGMGLPYRLSTVAELRDCFTGLELLEPGIVPINAWRPEQPQPVHVDGYGGVARVVGRW